MKLNVATLFVCLSLSSIGLGRGIVRPEVELVGGSISGPLSPSPFPSTVAIKNWCTATKIGAKTFLTAAHCVFDFSAKTYNSRFLAGQQFEITNLPNPYAILPWITVTVETPILDPAFIAKCAASSCDYATTTDGAQDVALIRVMEDTPTIPIASVDYRFMLPNDSIDIMGYGCEMGSGPLSTPGTGDPSLPFGRLKTQNTLVARDDVPALVGVLAGSASHLFNFYSAGQPTSATSASLCPGDSGGPVYLHGGGVVGVNSGGFGSSATAASPVNKHARLTNAVVWMPAEIR